MNAVFDTNIVIDALNGVSAADAEYNLYDQVRLLDAIIWATAQVNDAVLVTRNTKDFQPEGEGIHIPYLL